MSIIIDTFIVLRFSNINKLSQKVENKKYLINFHKSERRQKRKKYLIILFSILFITYFFGSSKQADKYKDSKTFWQSAYFDCPKYHLVLASLGKIFLQQGNIEQGYKYYKYNYKQQGVHHIIRL